MGLPLKKWSQGGLKWVKIWTPFFRGLAGRPDYSLISRQFGSPPAKTAKKGPKKGHILGQSRKWPKMGHFFSQMTSALFDPPGRVPKQLF